MMKLNNLKFTSLGKVTEFAAFQTTRLSEKTLARTEEASSFLTDIADVFLFVHRIIKETFSTSFEFKEFFYGSAFKIGYKTAAINFGSWCHYGLGAYHSISSDTCRFWCGFNACQEWLAVSLIQGNGTL
jgi:hypothetical protein